MDQLRVTGVVLDARLHAMDVEVHRPGVLVVAPDHVEELVAREGPSGVAHEEEQQLELAGFRAALPPAGLARLRIQDEALWVTGPVPNERPDCRSRLRTRAISSGRWNGLTT